MASVAWDRMPFDLDKGIEADLKQRLSTIPFTVRPPWGCQTDDPFEDGLFKVACQLVAGVDEALGWETVVNEFIWAKSRKRIGLSRQMEHDMAKGLALTGVLQVVQQDHNSQEPIPANVRAIVSGEFGFDGSMPKKVCGLMRGWCEKKPGTLRPCSLKSTTSPGQRCRGMHWRRWGNDLGNNPSHLNRHLVHEEHSGPVFFSCK